MSMLGSGANHLETGKIKLIMSGYNKFKMDYARDIKFDPNFDNLSK